MSTRRPSSSVRFTSIRGRLALAVTLVFALVAAPAALAAKAAKPVQVKVKPASATLPVDGTKRFNAAVKNTRERGVAWSVDGVPGGNPAVGTIDSVGIYRAPAWSGPGMTVTVTAASIADPAAAASARVKILPGGEPLTVATIAPAALETGPVSLTIAGAGFRPSCRVLLGTVELSTTFVSATQLLATGVLPDSLAPQAALVVLDPGPPRRASQPKTVPIAARPPPAITALVPASVHPGPVTLSISGSGFDAASRVLLGAEELATTLLSPTAVQATGIVPEALVPGAPVVVVDAANPARRSNAVVLAVSLPPLVLEAAAPARVYNGPVTFAISGTGFEPDTVARLGDLALTTTVLSPTQLSASGEVPESMVPGAPLVLFDGGRPERQSAAFAIAIDRVTPLELSTVEPAALYAGAVELTIRGSGFTPATRVQLGPLALTTTFLSDTLLFAAGIVPDTLAPGAPLVLHDDGPPARSSAPLAVPVTPVEPLVVTAVSPDSIAPGKVTFTITGAGFNAATRAAIGTTPLTTKFVSATALQATGTVPEGLAPGADLVLHDGGPPARDSAPYRIQIEALAPIQLASVTPSTVATGSASFTLEGSGFTANSKATLGSLTLATTFVSATRLTATGTIPTSMVPRASMTVVESTPAQRRSNAITVTIEYGVNTKVTIDPATASMPAASGMQFDATLQGDPEHPFAWAVNGIPGGNDALGKVNDDGWYTAPPMPPNPPVVTITATSSTTPPATGQSVVTITNPLPTIAGVFPDAVRPGAFTISVRGAGYMPASRVLYDGVDIAVTYVSPTRLEARGTASREAGRKAAIQVVNPDPGGSVSPPATLAILSDPGTTTYRVSAAEAGRFLEQAAFGPDAETLDRVRELGFERWIDEQFALPESEYPVPLEKCLDVDVRLAFSRAMLQGEDQLRQRMI
nr:IPT/TIG domain-containing protein [Acidobacteriota bacterium]